MERNQEKIVIGGGIAGLLKTYFNPDSILISEQIGGQFKTPFQLGPKYLHVDKYTKQFFSEVGLRIIGPGIKKVKVGFFYNNTLHKINTKENRKRYFKKTRGEGEIYKSSMSSNMTEFDSYDIEINEIINFLKDKTKDRTVLGTVEGINNRKRKITVSGKVFEYKKLISTIPMNIFLYLNDKQDISKLFKTYPTTFVFSQSEEIINKVGEYDYVYFSEPKYPFHRITRTDEGLVLEFKGDGIEKVDAEVDRYILKTGQIIENKIKINLQHVEFFGRYGCWKHHIKINDLLKQIYGPQRNI